MAPAVDGAGGTVPAGCLDVPGRQRTARKLLLRVGDLEVALGELLDVDVLKRHDLDVLDEPCGPVHVPHPGVLHGDLEEHLAIVGRADVQLDLVGEVEPALRLDHVGKQAHDVPILPIELELHLGLVLLEIFRAHALPSDQAATGATAQLGSTISQSSRPASVQAASGPEPPPGSSTRSPLASPTKSPLASPTRSPTASPYTTRGPGPPQVTLFTFTKECRCSGHGPCVLSALI